MLKQSYTAVIERNRVFSGRLESEPYECGWAGEAIFFVRKLAISGDVHDVPLQVQISPDGMRWADEGTTLTLSQNEIDFCKVTHFGNWLRLTGDLPPGLELTLIITLHLKE